MISLIQAPFNAQDRGFLQELFAKRYELFVEGRGWQNLARSDRLDIDQYDDEHTIYIIKRIGDEIVGGARLRPTVKDHMLDQVFGFLCEGGRAPVGAAVFECSRTFVARRHPQRRAIFAEVLLAAAEFCVQNGVDTLTGVLETWWLNSYLALGLDAKPLGMPHDVDDMSLLAVSFHVDQQVVENLRKRHAAFSRPSRPKPDAKSSLHAA